MKKSTITSNEDMMYTLALKKFSKIKRKNFEKITREDNFNLFELTNHFEKLHLTGSLKHSILNKIFEKCTSYTFFQYFNFLNYIFMKDDKEVNFF